MENKDRRKWIRAILPTPTVAATLPLEPECEGLCDPGRRRFLYVDIYNHCSKGAAIRSAFPFRVDKLLYLTVYNRPPERWKAYTAKVIWCRNDNPEGDQFLIGASLTPLADEHKLYFAPKDYSGPKPSDYDFFRKVPFLRAIHRDAVCPLLNSINKQRVKTGERFITQGDTGDKIYIIQSGECQVLIEKEGLLHPVAKIGSGDFIGEMALLTGEPRSAHVEAKSDMTLWEISRETLEKLIDSDPAVATFLTEIMSDRFSSRKMTANRSIGKYTITDIVGRGGYSIVYRGAHMDLNRPAAIKMLKHDMALNADFIKNFRTEAQIIASFNNENIVKVYDIEECYRTIFIIMEFLEGRTLKESIKKKGRIELKETISIIMAICKGLQYAHKKGIVHQDINPGNIFITTEGTAKILDFGLAAPCGSEHYMVGTAFYMSPEQVECLPVDGRSDIYSLGLTAFEMVTGKRPFPEADAHRTMSLHAEVDIPDPGDLKPDLHIDLRRFIIKACNRNPHDRYPTVSDAMMDLKQLAGQLGSLQYEPAFSIPKTKTLFLLYRGQQEKDLNDLVDEFTAKLNSLGMDLKAAD
jgi:eukaryotic-like serine/threonine-protein kinase